jgi:hypothetical protein
VTGTGQNPHKSFRRIAENMMAIGMTKRAITPQTSPGIVMFAKYS